ncbi:hypothetical protein CAPTEDRAFT_198653 [Capitella teleta]|uniref:G-protein coupled receptors family 3 profile domain-containing protein n=1 Tax=Capitella teleta TaxID=283909 RepID=R7V2Y7_CAPTE|nr:hypothetical protein CAPTEDRAFT_198653 [Capitella teleta]|eukprot:ELU12857.1 hypothetical protein CAPTEDRAFT_198653 [Capitella teleta]
MGSLEAQKALEAGDPTCDNSTSTITMKQRYKPNYFFALIRKFTANKGEGVYVFNRAYMQPPTKIMMIGPKYSEQAEVLAEIAAMYGVPQLSYSVTSPLLSNKKSYPYFARTVESTALQNPAMLKVLQHFGWKKVAKLTSDTVYPAKTSELMQQILNANNFTTMSTATFANDPTSQIEQIKVSGAKIILTFASSPKNSIRPLCQAYKQGVYGARYQWLHWSARHGILNQLDQKVAGDGCTHKQMVEAAEGLIYFGPVSVSQTPDYLRAGISGYTTPELEAKYLEYLTTKNVSTARQALYTSAFDAVWTAALAMNSSLSYLPLDEFTYGDQTIARRLYNATISSDFYGAGGHVAFDENGDKLNDVFVYQVRNGTGLIIAKYCILTGDLILMPNQRFMFAGGKPPVDSDEIVDSFIGISRPFFVVITMISCIGVIYGVLCIAFNLVYRNNRLIKLSSPRINTLIGVGCCLAFTSVVCYGVHSVEDSHSDWICGGRTCLLVYAFTFAFGGMFTKTWRVHVLFTNTMISRKIVKDAHLFAVIAGLLVVDTLLLIVWFLVDFPRWTIVNVGETRDDNVPGIINRSFVYICSSAHAVYWSGVLCSYKALLLMFGIFFTWETRKVTIEALNDSKQIGLCIYNVMVLSTVTFPLVNLLSVDQVSISYGVFSVAVLLCTFTTLNLVFAPKVATHGKRVAPFSRLLRQAVGYLESILPQNPHGGVRSYTAKTAKTVSSSITHVIKPLKQQELRLKLQFA